MKFQLHFEGGWRYDPIYCTTTLIIIILYKPLYVLQLDLQIGQTIQAVIDGRTGVEIQVIKRFSRWSLGGFGHLIAGGRKGADVKEGARKGLLSGGSLWRIADEETGHQGDGVLVGGRQNFLPRSWFLSSEADFRTVWQFGHLRPVFVRRRSQQTQHANYLFDVIFALGVDMNLRQDSEWK